MARVKLTTTTKIALTLLQCYLVLLLGLILVRFLRIFQ